MPQVSKRRLPKHIEGKLFDIFFSSFTKLSNSSDIKEFLFDLLGPVERTMLAKRFAIALLLIKGYNYEAIKEILKVSQETIARVNLSLNYRGDGYRKVINEILVNEKLEHVFDKIEEILINSLPPSGLKRSLTQERKTQKKRKVTLG